MNTVVKKASVFLNQKEIEYFLFEEDFVEENVRCIPMIVRFKMDKAGIKLKLSEWSRFSIDERKALAIMPCGLTSAVNIYFDYLDRLVQGYTGEATTKMEVDKDTAWADVEHLPVSLSKKAGEFGCSISCEQWKRLTDLQRFALMKLHRPGHENRNFPIALREFGLLDDEDQFDEATVLGKIFYPGKEIKTAATKAGNL